MKAHIPVLIQTVQLKISTEPLDKCFQGVRGGTTSSFDPRAAAPGRLLVILSAPHHLHWSLKRQ